MNASKQQGFLILIAIVMIIVFALLTSALVHFYMASTSNLTSLQAYNRALDYADSGLEDGQYLVRNGTACSGLNTTHSMGDGQYLLTGSNVANMAQSPLSAAITASSGSISVANSSVFNAQGTVIIDSEKISYYVNDTASNTLSGVVRGVDGTTAFAHASGTLVTQYECTVNSVGSSPATLPAAQIRLQQDVSQLAEAWAVGNNGTVMQWNQPTENQWNLNSTGVSVGLNSISMINYSTGWAVGNRTSGNTMTILQWNGASNSWSYSGSYPSINSNIYSINTTSSQEAWIVGSRQGSNNTLLRWLVATDTWCQVPNSGTGCGGKSISTSVSNSQKDLYIIKTIDTNGDGFANFGFAAGTKMLRYNGTQWSDYTMPALSSIQGISIIPNGSATPIEAWAVGTASNGTNGVILKWNGTSWSIVVTTTNIMHDLSMVSTTNNGLANYGWAVGNNGNAYVYNGSSWTNSNIGSTHLYGVVVVNNYYAWAVGANGNRYYWNGSSWVLKNTGVTTTQDLQSVFAIGSSQQHAIGWSVVSQ